MTLILLTTLTCTCFGNTVTWLSTPSILYLTIVSPVVGSMCTSLARSFAACQSRLFTKRFMGSSSVASSKSSGSSTAKIFSKTSSESSCSTASSVEAEDWS